MTEGVTHHFRVNDSTRIALHEMGEGRPLLLIHGYISDAETNWIKYGHAKLLAESGHRVIMPDLRGHGASEKPHDPARYPPDILVDDQLALIEYLGLSDYDLGGYSLGGRTVARMLARGATPGKAIIAGMGLAGITTTAHRAAHFERIFAGLGQHERGSTEWIAEAFIKTTMGDPVALRLILQTFVDTPVPDLARVDTPIAVICGTDDSDNGSAADLASALPNASLTTIPGNHMSAVAKPDLGIAMRNFLSRS